MVFVAVPSIYNVTNTAATNVVTQVTNMAPVQADLGVGDHRSNDRHHRERFDDLLRERDQLRAG